MASRLGGALSPLLVIPIQIAYGWRMSFYVFGVVGLIWCIIWYSWYRDHPAEKEGVTPSELEGDRRRRADQRTSVFRGVRR